MPLVNDIVTPLVTIGDCLSTPRGVAADIARGFMSPELDSHPADSPRRRWWPIAAVVAVVLVGAAGLTMWLLTPGTLTVNAEVSINNGCTSDDLAEGAQVEILDSASKVLAVGKLAAVGDSACKRTFVVPDVPVGEDLYGVRVGREERGLLWKTEAELRSGLSLTIG